MRHALASLVLLTAVALVPACGRDGAAPPAAAPAASAPATTQPAANAVVHDEHSFAEPSKVRTSDLALDIGVDFENRTIAGSATLQLEWLDPKATQLVLDTRDLTIRRVEGAGADGQWSELKFALAPAHELLGSKLTIEAPSRPAQVRIE